MSNKHYYIINPIAGGGKYKKFEQMFKNIASEYGNEIEFQFTTGTGHASELAANIPGENSTIISVGGDGTIHEVINGVDPKAGHTIAALPSGTGNDFSFELFGKMKMRDILHLINRGDSKREADVCRIEIQRIGKNETEISRMINGLGVGFDAYVSYLNNQGKIFSGVLSYLISVFKALQSRKPLNIELFLDNVLQESKILLLAAIGNGRRAGGGFYLTPNAKIDDRILDVSTMTDMSSFKLLRRLPMALIDKVEQIPEAILQQCKEVLIKFVEPHFIHCDGEILGNDVEWLKINFMDEKLKFFAVT